ncbi:MAG: DNA methyltransferase [Oscillospiraceae bacterium]|nr:DNA methyltransferase [Oscillospiraceae bacterium]
MKKYNIIYADPPWQYWGGLKRGSGSSHYPVMTLEEICALPVKDIAADDCVLFLWTTFPKLRESFAVMDAWGFEYKTVGFVWVKQNKKSDGWYMGMGWWTRANAEICLIATKGNPRRFAHDVRQLIVSPVEEHSKKPDITRDRIVRLAGNLPRIELFARQKTLGWDIWGNELKNDIELEERNE